MYCSNCGSAVNDGVNFCPNCGQALSSATTVSVSVEPEISEEARQKDELAAGTLKFGIIGMIFSLTFLLCIPGFILSIIAKARARKYYGLYGKEEGRVSTGRRMGNVGFIFGLIELIGGMLLVLALSSLAL